MESLFRAYSVDIYQWWNVSFLCKLKDVPPYSTAGIEALSATN